MHELIRGRLPLKMKKRYKAEYLKQNPWALTYMKGKPKARVAIKCELYTSIEDGIKYLIHVGIRFDD